MLPHMSAMYAQTNVGLLCCVGSGSNVAVHLDTHHGQETFAVNMETTESLEAEVAFYQTIRRHMP